MDIDQEPGSIEFSSDPHEHTDPSIAEVATLCEVARRACAEALPLAILSSIKFAIQRCEDQCAKTAQLLRAAPGLYAAACAACSEACANCANTLSEIGSEIGSELGDTRFTTCIDSCRRTAEACRLLSRTQHPKAA